MWNLWMVAANYRWIQSQIGWLSYSLAIALCHNDSTINSKYCSDIIITINTTGKT